jgi:hypothetical protein
MTTVAKMMDGRMVEVVRVADTVAFSDAAGWIMICMDWEKADRKKSEFKWIPAETRFDWVREFYSE